jgi:tetratricopeptide (TPR) repeat protein
LLATAWLLPPAGRNAAAVAQLDLWIAAHREHSKTANALNDCCWAQALWGRDLDRAEAHCKDGLKLRSKSSPDYTALLDSRGLVRLRRGNFEKSLADYDAALALGHPTAWSLLHDRGLDKLRLGTTAEAQADIAATVAKYGIAP